MVKILFFSLLVIAQTGWTCEIFGSEKTLADKGSTMDLEITFNTKTDFDDHNISGLKELTGYQEMASNKADVDLIALLKRQREFFKKSSYINVYDDIIGGEVGQIFDISCFEASLLELHWKKKGAGDFETEFAAQILEKDSKIKALMTSSSQAFVPLSKAIDKRKAELIAEGWVLKSHLHNHPFLLENPTGDIAGTVSPSTPDVMVYKTLYNEESLQNVSVTNGFSILESGLKG